MQLASSDRLPVHPELSFNPIGQLAEGPTKQMISASSSKQQTRDIPPLSSDSIPTAVTIQQIQFYPGKAQGASSYGQELLRAGTEGSHQILMNLPYTATEPASQAQTGHKQNVSLLKDQISQTLSLFDANTDRYLSILQKSSTENQVPSVCREFFSSANNNTSDCSNLSQQFSQPSNEQVSLPVNAQLHRNSVKSNPEYFQSAEVLKPEYRDDFDLLALDRMARKSVNSIQSTPVVDRSSFIKQRINRFTEEAPGGNVCQPVPKQIDFFATDPAQRDKANQVQTINFLSRAQPLTDVALQNHQNQQSHQNHQNQQNQQSQQNQHPAPQNPLLNFKKPSAQTAGRYSREDFEIIKKISFGQSCNVYLARYTFTVY